jgi:hypothetical protein
VNRFASNRWEEIGEIWRKPYREVISLRSAESLHQEHKSVERVSQEQSRGSSHKWQRDKSQEGFQKFLVSSQPVELVLSQFLVSPVQCSVCGRLYCNWRVLS